MNKRIKYIILFVIFGSATYIAARLTTIIPYPNVFNSIFAVLSILFGAVSLLWIVKIISPKTRLSEILWSILGTPF